jgi:hypothetical protein
MALPHSIEHDDMRWNYPVSAEPVEARPSVLRDALGLRPAPLPPQRRSAQAADFGGEEGDDGCGLRVRWFNASGMV